MYLEHLVVQKKGSAQKIMQEELEDIAANLTGLSLVKSRIILLSK